MPLQKGRRCGFNPALGKAQGWDYSGLSALTSFVKREIICLVIFCLMASAQMRSRRKDPECRKMQDSFEAEDAFSVTSKGCLFRQLGGPVQEG